MRKISNARQDSRGGEHYKTQEKTILRKLSRRRLVSSMDEIVIIIIGTADPEKWYATV